MAEVRQSGVITEKVPEQLRKNFWGDNGVAVFGFLTQARQSNFDFIAIVVVLPDFINICSQVSRFENS